MDFEKLTDRARGFLQAAQTIAVREHHQRIAPAHLLKALLDDEQGMAAGLIAGSRRRRSDGAARGRPAGVQDPGRDRHRRDASPSARRRYDPDPRPGRAGREEGRRHLCDGRADPARHGARQEYRGGRCAREGRADARKISTQPLRNYAADAPPTRKRPKTAMMRSSAMRAISPRRRARASSIRSSAATRRSAAPSRCWRGAPRTIRC